MTIRKIRLGWKYRRLLRKYRWVSRHRQQIAGVALVVAALAGGAMLRPHRSK
jgi:hypothetical protein